MIGEATGAAAGFTAAASDRGRGGRLVAGGNRREAEGTGVGGAMLRIFVLRIFRSSAGWANTVATHNGCEAGAGTVDTRTDW